MSDDNIHKTCQSTPDATLRDRICDSRIPKSEAEWWAGKEIEKLEAELASVREELEIEKARFPVIGSPLQKLGAYLADLLVEDQWLTAEQYLLAAQAEQERVARRAYERGITDGTKDRIDGEDDAIAQAMREGGE